MGNFETMRFVVVVDRVTATGADPTFSLSLMEEPDLTYTRFLSAVPINGATLTRGQTNLLTASDPAMPASYGYRLDYALAGTSPSAHVRIWVTGRGRA